MIIPIFGQVPDSELTSWQTELNKAIPNITIKLEHELTATDKTQTKFAIVANPSREQLEQYPNLEWVQSLWAGVENLVNVFSQSPIKVTRLIDPGLADTMSEAMLTWCLYFQRDFHRYAQDQSNQRWQPKSYREASQCHIGILGLGNLGIATSRRLMSHGYQVSGWSRSEKQLEGIETYSGTNGLRTLLTDADVILCLLPLTTQTKGFIDKDFWQQCKPGVCFVNAGRGGTINDDALVEALNSRRVEHAVLDVFDQEPLPNDHPFWHQPNITVLPHICSPTRVETAAGVVAKNLRQVIEEQSYPELVDFSKGY